MNMLFFTYLHFPRPSGKQSVELLQSSYYIVGVTQINRQEVVKGEKFALTHFLPAARVREQVA